MLESNVSTQQLEGGQKCGLVDTSKGRAVSKIAYARPCWYTVVTSHLCVRVEALFEGLDRHWCVYVYWSYVVLRSTARRGLNCFLNIEIYGEIIF